jgi:diacylglycerol kinase (ATP)
MWAVMLCSFEGVGGGLILAPGADPADGKLDVVMAEDLGRWESLTQIIPNFEDGSHTAHPKISRRHATWAMIESNRMVRADVDGESIGQLPISVVLLSFRV